MYTDYVFQIQRRDTIYVVLLAFTIYIHPVIVT